MRSLLTHSLFVLVLLTGVLIPAPGQAQTVHNPSAVEFTASPDHATLTGYELDIVRKSDGVVIQTISLGKPTPNASNVCTVAINVQPVAFNTYISRARSVAGGTKGQDSAPSPDWIRSPGAPTNVNVK